MVLHMESQYYFEATTPGDSYLTYLLSPPTPPEPLKDLWTAEENETFERCIAELDHLSRDFFENVAQRIPRKSVGQIQKHYEALIVDVEMIDSGRVPVPDYDKYEEMMVGEKTKPSNEPLESESTHQAPRRRGVAWSTEEHALFLEGLAKYGKGDWKSISRNSVKTRNPTQVASHAQKYFKRLKNESTRRRFSRFGNPTDLPSTSAINRPSICMPSLRFASIGRRRIGHSLAYYRG